MNQGTARASNPDPELLFIENRRLRKAFHGLEMLEDIADAATSNLPAEAIINLIIEKSVEGLDAQSGALHLFDDDSSEPRVTTLARYGEAPGEAVPAAVAAAVLGWAIKEGKVLRSNDLEYDPRVGRKIAGVQSVLTVPLRWKDSLVGLLSVFNKLNSEGFTDEDEKALSVIAAHSAYVLQSAELIGQLKDSTDRLERENSELKNKIRSGFQSPMIVGDSVPIRDLLKTVEQISGVNVDVLITGESGTGKELFARTIHDNSLRVGKPFVGINCAALPDTLLEAELFGVEKGVATGVDRRQGHFETAHQGTLFLDEIGDLSLSAQAKILRVLQERNVRRVGGSTEIPVDVRIIAATHAPLEQPMEKGDFREDLFYRLNVIRLHTPALREIPEDIELLAKHFAAISCKQIGREQIEISDEVMEGLIDFAWPGNVRQLSNEMKRLAICVRGRAARLEDLSSRVREGGGEIASPGGREPYVEKLASYEKGLIEQSLANHSGNQVETANALGLSRSGLHKKMKRLGIR